MKEPNRFRKVQLNFRVTERERALIEERMAELGTTNREAYLRKIAMDGMIVKVEVPELKGILSLMRYAGNNINQIAHRLNAGGHLYPGELTNVQAQQERLWAELDKLLAKLNAMQ